MAKQTIVKPGGIITKPNEYGELAPGSLSIGDGIQIRRQSIIEPRNAFMKFGELRHDQFNRVMKFWTRTYSALTLPERYTIELPHFFLIAYDANDPTQNKLYNHEYGSDTTTEVLRAPGASFNFSRNKAHFSTTREHTIVTSNAPPSITALDGNFRPAGLPPAMVYKIETDASGTNWKPEKYLSYAAVFRYEEPGGYVIRGPIYGKLSAFNSSVVDRAPHVYVSWAQDAYVPEGTVIEFYRVPQQETSDLLGDDYKLAFEHVLTAAEIAAHSVDLIDRTVDEALGTYLYTNEAQEGANKINQAPPQSRDVFTFKGATFYVSTDTTQQLSLRLPSIWGPLTTAEERAHGIGWRGTTGTFNAVSTTATIADPTGVRPGQVIKRMSDGTVWGTVKTVVGSTITLGSLPPSSVTNEPISILDVITVQEEGGLGATFFADYPGEFLGFLGNQVKLGATNTGAYFSSPNLVVGSPILQSPTLTLRQFKPDSRPFFVTSTNGQNFSPPLVERGFNFPLTGTPSKSDPRTNRVHFSKIAQPEHVPPLNTFLVGSGAILKLWATQDSLFAFCTDGIYRIDGDGDDWSVKPVDPDTVLLSADAVDSMDNTIYAFTNVGLISLQDSGGVVKITSVLYNDDYQRLWLGEGLEKAYAAIACDRPNHEAWVNFRYDDEYVATYIWNGVTKTLVTQSEEHADALAYSPVLQTMISGRGHDLRETDPNAWMFTDVEFNSVVADDVGVLKQWIDVTLFFENLLYDGWFWPAFNGEDYPDNYQIVAAPSPFDHVVAPVLNATNLKHLRFRFRLAGWSESAQNTNYQLKGLAVRYRVAAEPLTR